MYLKELSNNYLDDHTQARQFFTILVLFIFTLFLHSTLTSLSAQSIGNGKDGSPAISGIINSYTAVTTDVKRCQKQLTVKSTSYFSKGDLVLIMQMQGAVINNTNTSSYGSITDYANAGNYEYAVIDSIGNQSIFLQNPVLRDFSVEGLIQLIFVPQYENPVIAGTLKCKSWDGETGGVLAFDAKGKVSFNGNINVNGKGFRGGKILNGDHFFSFSHDFIGESFDPNWYGVKGEGIALDGVFPYTSGRGAPANGGGGGNIHTAGGGGGSNYGCGGKGGWGYPVDSLGNQYDCQGIGGYAINYTSAENKVFAGGGGGAGHEHYNNGTSGSEGGGIVIITADTVLGNSKMISANGNSSASSGTYGDGTGGAGAGGTILLIVDNFTDTLNIFLKGGDGGSSILKGFGPGGGGGGGALLLSGQSLPGNLVISSMAGGFGGLAGGNYYGAENGCSGGIAYNFKATFNNYYQGVTASFSFEPGFLSEENNSLNFYNLSSGASNYDWNFGDGGVSSSENPSHTYETLRDYNIRLIAADSICRDTSIVKVLSENVPDIFTPNGDGINDMFYFSSLSSFTNSELRIFNRWGKIVFYRTAERTDELMWDGKENGKAVPEGTYYFVINYLIASGEEKIHKGSLLLLR